MLRFKNRGGFSRTLDFLKKKRDPLTYLNILHRYGKIGVEKLSQATPVRTGLTAASWVYKVESTSNGYVVSWDNTNTQKGTKIAILIDSGHTTSRGFYVQGKHYIAPAMAKTFDDLARAMWEEVIHK